MNDKFNWGFPNLISTLVR